MSCHASKQTGIVPSFKKKGSEALSIRGTRISTQNAQLLTSTGSSTLDFFIGGGLAIGTICLIEEDNYNTYSNILLKYFLAEGVANSHKLLLCSGDKSSESILQNLPSMKVPEMKSKDNDMNSVPNEDLRIAWRYQNQSSSFASDIKAASYNHGYDLSKPMGEDFIKNSSPVVCDPPDLCESKQTEEQNFLLPPYSSLLQRISTEIKTNKFRTSVKGCSNIMRIAINSLGSPLWNCSSESNQDLQLVRFLYMLKALLRTSFAVAIVSVPSYLLKQNAVLRNRIRQTCDTILSLESFVGSDKKSNPLFKEFDGLLQIVKLPILNTFVYPNVVSDLAFKLKRKDFLIERLHLPPDFEESSGEPSSFGCSGQASKLDF